MRFHSLRSLRFIILALLLLALRLSGGIVTPFLVTANTHTQHTQHDGNTVFVCPVTGLPMPGMTGTDAPTESPHYAMGVHCPFCLTGHNALVLPCADFSFSPPEPAATAFLPPFSSGSLPPVPDNRHASPRAPPSFA
ncbi:MAG: DUF2946 domain-containing protein [Zoogloeaceae bacterium]|nr:DUF2946 domain-containing protein [Zoogloeaceae bacterium]